MKKYSLLKLILLLLTGSVALSSGTAYAQSSLKCSQAKELLNEAQLSGYNSRQAKYFRSMVKTECARKPETIKRTAPKKAVPPNSGSQRAAPVSGFLSPSQCTAATKRLAQLQEARQSDTPEGKRLYAIWSSRYCSNLRNKGDFDVSSDMNKMKSRLKANGINIDARIAKARRECRSSSTDRNQQQKCALDRELILYANAINEMNANSRQKYQANMRKHRDAVARVERLKRERREKVARNKASYEKSLREWREAVAQCKKGKKEYCASQ